MSSQFPIELAGPVRFLKLCAVFSGVFFFPGLKSAQEPREGPRTENRLLPLLGFSLYGENGVAI